MKTFKKSGTGAGRLVAAGTLAVSACTAMQGNAWAALHGHGKDAQVATQAFDIPAGPLSSALDRFRQVTGISVAMHLPPDEVAGFHSKGAKGTLTNEAALEAILADTGLGYKLERGGTRAEIQIQNADQVSVTASSNSVGLGQFTESLTDTAQTDRAPGVAQLFGLNLVLENRNASLRAGQNK